MALDTNKVVSVSLNTSKNVYEEVVLDLKYKIKNLILVDNCIVAQEVDRQGTNKGLCRFVPRYLKSNEFVKEVSQISDCDILLQYNSDGRCFGFNNKIHCFVGFTLKKPLLNNLENNQGEIRENLKFLNFYYTPLFNGLHMK